MSEKNQAGRQMSAGQFKHIGLLAFAAILLLAAVLGPTVAQPSDYHDFADARTLLGIHDFMDLTSNAFFAIGALAIGWAWSQYHRTEARSPVVSALGLLAAIGFATAALASTLYHWDTNNETLLWDRAGMLPVFAAVVGLAVYDRVSTLAAGWSALAVLIAGAVSLWVWYGTSNFLPWSLLQGGGMLLTLVLAFVPRRGDGKAVNLSLGWLIGWYVLAKVFELADHAVFDWTAQTISGHTLKHLFAAAAALPLASMLVRNATAGEESKAEPSAEN